MNAGDPTPTRTGLRSMPLAYRLGYLAFRAIFRFYFRYRVHGAKNVPMAGPVILASNHASYLDPPLVGAGVPRLVSMLARNSLFRFPVFGPLLRSWKAVPVDPKGGSVGGLRVIIERIKAGGVVLIFPEGTRSHDGELLPVRSGLGMAVIKSGAPVVPVRIRGSHRAYGRHMWFPLPRRLEVTYGKLMRFDDQCEEARNCSKGRLKEIYQEVSEQVMNAIAAN